MNILAQLKAERDKIAQHLSALNNAITALSGLNGHRWGTAERPRRRMSAAGRARIAAAQRARWAKARRQHKIVSITQASKTGKRTMSASARRKIAAAQRARWARWKARKKAA
jgi:hypothetical protein